MDMEKLKSSYIGSKTENSAVTLEKSANFSMITQLQYDATVPLLGSLIICTWMLKNIIHDSQKLWGECLSNDAWIKKMWYIHKMEYYLSIKRVKSWTCYNTDDFLKYYAKWKKAVTKDHIFHDSIYRKYSISAETQTSLMVG